MEIITVGMSPNTEHDDVQRALQILFMPWRWYKDDERKKVIDWFKKKFDSSHVTLFSSGRSALTALLESFGIGAGNEVILQAFTCMVVPNAIRFSGATPKYVDIDDSANINPDQLEKSITKKTKAIIVQHTFGTPADMDKVMVIAKKHKVFVIEDCAHALGAVYKGKKVGTIGDAAFFSFGRDKIISSVFGGAAIAKNRQAAQRLEIIEHALPNPSFFWIFQQLCHPVTMSVILPFYKSGIGKILLVLLQKLHFLSFPVSKSEVSGIQPKHYCMRYPNALAYLLTRQLQKLDRYTKVRQSISEYYEQELKKLRIAYLDTREQSARLRFGITTDKQQILLKAKQHNILLGNWYHNVVDPKGSDMSKAGYQQGSCPKAEQLAKTIVNLPTRITQKQAEKIIRVFNSL
ncbi:MAG: DegT/DnrJ/EryC1/StrS aminotransferase [Microgenomates group bacterium GW2011_GWC1_39_12]|nr:MAG: DegT/DnrJ/EryC1/StrS aminotransferase [Microgenomates group bacterium GW2011_GWC1_39_12]